MTRSKAPTNEVSSFLFIFLDRTPGVCRSLTAAGSE